MQVVTRREALAVRRSRERILAVSGGGDDPVARLTCGRPGPADRAERRERVEETARALAALKRDQRLAIVLQALGYSHREIGELCGWTYTKVSTWPSRAPAPALREWDGIPGNRGSRP
jgi:DNA-directed RNA polymerase specialized sigma24 family protein